MSMTRLLVTLVLALTPALAQADQGYEPATPDGAASRTLWFLPTTGSRLDQALTPSQFKREYQGQPVVVYTHGCSGPYWPEERRVVEYFTQRGWAVAWNHFTRRVGVGPSCSTDLSQLSKNYESTNPRRIQARLKELEAVQDWVRANTNASRFVIAGWSEGGRTVGLWQRPVAGVIIFGMDCKYPGFWDINRGQPTLIFRDTHDPWIEAPGRVSRSCATWFNSGWVTELFSSNMTHAPIPTQREYDLLDQWLATQTK